MLSTSVFGQRLDLIFFGRLVDWTYFGFNNKRSFVDIKKSCVNLDVARTIVLSAMSRQPGMLYLRRLV